VDVRVEQGEQRQRLMDVARFQAPGFLMQQRLLVHVEDHQLVTLDRLDPADESLFIEDELVDVNRRQVVDELYAMPGAPVILTGVDLAHTIPERAGHVVITLRQQRDVIDQLVGVVVLGVDTAGARLQAHVDVLGHQHHGQAGVARLQLHQLVDDLVVVEVFRQPGHRRRTFAHEDGKTPAGAALAALDGYPVLDVLGLRPGENLIDQADGLATFGGDAVLAGLQFVEFLQHRHRDGDVVFFEVEQGVGIVNQDVGVESVEGWSGGLGASVVIHTSVTFL